MNFFKIILLLVTNFNAIYSYDYLNNHKVDYNISQLDIDYWFDEPVSGFHNSYPPTGINCITSKEDEKYVYMISSQPLIEREWEYHSCGGHKRKVSIFKRDLNISLTVDHIVIGEAYTGNHQYKCYRWNEHDMEIIESFTGTERHNKEVELCENKGHYWRLNMNPIPNECYCSCCQKIINPVGGKGSDYVTSCNIDEETNILYYIGGNYHSCSSVFGTDPSIVRINLTDFSFIDRTLLNQINGYSQYVNWTNFKLDSKYRYYNFPGESELVNGKIYLSFQNINHGIWEINLRAFPIEIVNGYQKMVSTEITEQNGNVTNKYLVYNILPPITKSLYDEKNNLLYFVSESFIDNAVILKINLTEFDYYNTSKLIELDGINNIKDIKYDSNKNLFYLLTGQLSSKLYKLDENFNIIALSDTCSIDSLMFPTEWKVAESMELDLLTDILYVFFVNEPFNGFVTVRTNDFQYDNFNQFVFYRRNQPWTPIRLNITRINRFTGKMIVANFADARSMFQVISEINLLGCSKGKRKDLNNCISCPPGTYTNIYGSNICNLCGFGHSTLSEESKNCFKCDKGYYANVLGSSSCLPCKPGNYSEIKGSKNCKMCESGKFSLKEKSITPTECLECDSGKYSDRGSNVCFNCNLGEYVLNKRSCVKCPRGKYGDIYGITTVNECKNCDRGKYVNKTGSDSSTDCKTCQEGKYSLIEGGTSRLVCLNCPKGRYRNNLMNAGSECSICDNGKYSLLRSNECIECPPGKYNIGVEESDHINCLNCVSGKYNENNGANSIDKCLDCPLGKYSVEIGLDNINGCKNCDDGSFNDILGSNKYSDCKSCPNGKYLSKSGTSLNDCLDCPVGKYSLEKSSECFECQIGKYNSLIGSSECKFCEEGKFTDSNNTMTCDECPENSEPNHNYDKCECIKGTYMEKSNPLICTVCPENFICDKGATIETLILEKGYWRANKTTLHVEKCKKGYNCLGGKLNESSDELCNIGHTGPICDVCMDGWAKNEGKCFKCLTDTHVIVRSYSFTILFPFIITAIIYFMIKTANPNSGQAQKEPLSGVIKIFMNYAQIFTLSSSFEINWPEIVNRFFDRTKEFSSPKISFFSSDCTIGWKYYDKLLIYILLPIFYVLVVTAILSIYTFYFYKNKRDKKIESEDEDKQKYLEKHPEPIIFYRAWMCTSILIGLFLAWPTIIKQSLSIIPCKQFGDKYYLLQDLSVECYTIKYNVYLILSYISLFVYGLVVPFIAFNLIRVKRFSLYDYESKYEMPAPLSFLFLGYREEVWYYEFIVMAKKYSMILITVFLKEYSRYQMISASLFVQTAFFIHVFLRPYDSITNYGILCNKLESISLLALVVTLNSGLFFGTINDQYNLGSFEIVLIVLLFIMNLLVFIYFLYYLIKLSFKEGKDRFKKLYLELYKRKSFVLKMFSKKKQEEIFKWSNIKDVDTHGINLKSTEEIELFEHFFNDKRMFSHELKKILEENEELNQFDQLLNRIRSKIEIIEKQRCWLSVLNNRLYKKLRKELVENNDDINSDNIDQLNDILDNYINKGLKYSKTIDEISKRALGSIRSSIIEMKTLNDENTSYENTSDEHTSNDESSEEEITDDFDIDEKQKSVTI